MVALDGPGMLFPLVSEYVMGRGASVSDGTILKAARIVATRVKNGDVVATDAADVVGKMVGFSSGARVHVRLQEMRDSIAAQAEKQELSEDDTARLVGMIPEFVAGAGKKSKKLDIAALNDIGNMSADELEKLLG